MSLIKLDHVSKYYSDGNTSSRGIEDINLEFKKGEFIAITGESGSGKTTLLNVITLMDNYDEGDILIDGKSTADFTDKEMREFRREYVSFVFQDYNLFQSLSPLKNLVIALRNRGYTQKEAVKIAKARLEECGLKSRMHEKTIRLSGGERQRVVIARALAINSPIIAFDEPTGNLDSKTSAEIINLINKIKTNHLILFVTHEYDLIKDIATRHITLKDGQIENDEILKEPYISEETTNNLSVDKPSFASMIFASLQIIISSPKKFILTCLSQLLLAVAAVGISFGFVWAADRIDVAIQQANDELYEDVTRNMTEQSLLIVNNENTFTYKDKDALIDKNGVLTYLNFKLQYQAPGDAYYTIYQNLIPSLTVPETAKIIKESQNDEPGYQIFYDAENMSQLTANDYKAFFESAFNNQMTGLIKISEYSLSPCSNFTLNGFGTYESFNTNQSDDFMIVFNQSAYEIIQASAESFIKDGLTNNSSFTLPIKIEDNDFFSIFVNDVPISYSFQQSYSHNLEPTFLFNPSYESFIDEIKIRIFSKTYTLKEYYSLLHDYYGDISFEYTENSQTDVFFERNEYSSNCIISIPDYNTLNLEVFLAYKLNLFTTIYFDSSKQADEAYEKYKDSYQIFNIHSRLQINNDIDEYKIIYNVSTAVGAMFGLTLFLLLVLSLTSPILNMILRKYNPDFGVMQTLGFSQKFLFLIRLFLIEIPLILTYAIAASCMIPTIFSTISNSYGAYWYIFVLFSLLMILFAFLLCLSFYRKEKKRSMSNVLKDAGGK